MIQDFLKYILLKLDDELKEILALFYVLNLNSQFLISKDMLEKSIKRFESIDDSIGEVRTYNTQNAIEELEKLGWIEKDDNLYRPIYHGKYSQDISLYLQDALIEIEKDRITKRGDLSQTQDNMEHESPAELNSAEQYLLKFRKNIIEDGFKTFIDNKDRDQLCEVITEIIDIVSDIMQDAELQKGPRDQSTPTNTPKKNIIKLPQTSPIQKLNTTGPEFDINAKKKYLIPIVEIWKKGNKHLHAKAMASLGQYFKSNNEQQKSLTYYQSSLDAYDGKQRKEDKITKIIKYLEQSILDDSSEKLGLNDPLNSTSSLLNDTRRKRDKEDPIEETETSLVKKKKDDKTAPKEHSSSDKGPLNENLKKAEKLSLSITLHSSNNSFNFKNHLIDIIDKQNLLDKIKGRNLFIDRLDLVKAMMDQASKYTLTSVDTLLPSTTNTNLNRNISVKLIPENNHLRDHRRNIDNLIQAINQDRIDNNTVIVLERKQNGKNLGIRDVILFALILKYNEDKGNIIPINIDYNSPLYKDAELYNMAQSKNIRVIGMLTCPSKLNHEDKLGTEDNILYTINQLCKSQNFTNIILPIGSAHEVNIKEALAKLDIKIEDYKPTYIHNNERWQNKITLSSNAKAIYMLKN